MAKALIGSHTATKRPAASRAALAAHAASDTKKLHAAPSARQRPKPRRAFCAASSAANAPRGPASAPPASIRPRNAAAPAKLPAHASAHSRRQSAAVASPSHQATVMYRHSDVKSSPPATTTRKKPAGKPKAPKTSEKSPGRSS